MMSLKEKYNKEVAPAMMKKFGNSSIMAVPRIEKVSVNTGFGRLVVGKTNDEQKKLANAIADDLTLICGQKAVVTIAKKSIATFKTRVGMPMGAMVTLRGEKMYSLLERLVNVALPRTRDFRGIDEKSFDKSGNLNIAIKENLVFPEISPEKSKSIFGLQVTVVVKSGTKEEKVELLKLLGFPIRKQEASMQKQK
jgi:large subunit ribosomal protein L5